MTPFDTLSPLARAIFALWSLLLCLGGIINTILPLWKKRFLFSAIAFVLFVPAYFMWQVIFDIALYGRLGIEVSTISETLGNITWSLWLVAFIALTTALLFLLGYNIHYEKKNITIGSIKKYLDKIPCGVCCYNDSGKVLFVNMCMNELCVALTDGKLLNGVLFHDVVADKILTVDQKMWRFSCRELTVGKEKLHEIIASDVTGEYSKTQALEKDKAELSRLNSELKEYNSSINETVRRQEILQAKVNIHDEMNRLMLSTVSAESKDAKTIDKIFSLWEQNALLLCLQANDSSDNNATSRINELAEALNIRLNRQTDPPSSLTEEQRNLILSATHEAVANAAKHAGAKEMTISFIETETSIECRFTNDGKMPQNEVTYTGGLLNLARLAAKQGATIVAYFDNKFTLSLIIPRQNQPTG